MHVFWECNSATALWIKLIEHWTGERASRERTKQFLVACASRQAHTIQSHRMKILNDRFQDDIAAATRVWKEIWHILATMCQTRIWTDRNAAVFRAEPIDITRGTESFWASCIRQLRAIA